MPKREERNTGNQVDLGQLVNSAIQGGIETIVKEHPRFENKQDLLISYLDKKKINDYIKDYMDSSGGRVDPHDLTEKFGSYVASGGFFDDKGKEIILSYSLKKDSRGFFGGGARKMLEGEKYLDKTMTAFRDLYGMLQKGGYAEKMPELTKAVSTVYDMGFADAAVNVLYAHGLMDEGKYNVLKEAIADRAKEGVEYTNQQLTEMVTPQKAVAAVIGVVGAGILLSSNKLTGAVIGVNETNLLSLVIGGLLLVAGIFFGFKRR
jgi:hypothetical protein